MNTCGLLLVCQLCSRPEKGLAGWGEVQAGTFTWHKPETKYCFKILSKLNVRNFVLFEWTQSLIYIPYWLLEETVWSPTHVFPLPGFGCGAGCDLQLGRATPAPLTHCGCRTRLTWLQNSSKNNIYFHFFPFRGEKTSFFRLLWEIIFSFPPNHPADINMSIMAMGSKKCFSGVLLSWPRPSPHAPFLFAALFETA